MKRGREYPLEEPNHSNKKQKLEDTPDQILRFQSDDTQSEEYVDEKMATPWYKQSTRNIQDPMLRFHNELIDFVNYLSPTDQQHKMRTDAFQFMKVWLTERLGEGITIQSFGSFKTRTYLPNADIDLVLMVEGANQKKIYDKVSELLKNDSNFEQVNYIKSAKVPIIKLVLSRHRLHFDLTVNKMDGVFQLKEVEKAFKFYPQLRYIMFTIKCMLKQRELSETYTGGIGSFLLFCMILAFLRECRKINKNYTLGEYILHFLAFYGVDNWTERRILMRKAMIVQRQPDGNIFSLISPQDETHDIGNSAFKIKDVFAVFRNRHRLLTNFNFRNGESIVKYLVNPCGGVFSFIKQE